MKRVDAAQRLIVYGSLAPGGTAHQLVAGLRGSWAGVRICGHIEQRQGYPVFTPDRQGAWISAWMLESPELPAHWPVLDAYEGDGYARQSIEVEIGGETLTATIYIGA